MPRRLRIEYPGALYHLMSRGNRRDKIFLDDVDRHDFIKTLAEACQKTGWQVHAYCLMPNHYHLVVDGDRRTVAARSDPLRDAQPLSPGGRWRSPHGCGAKRPSP